MNTVQSEIKIYVACLAAYNSGVLHGAWIDATQGESGVWDDINAMLKSSPIPNAEEFAIHDYEGFEDARIEEYSNIENVCEIAIFIANHGTLGGKLLEYFGNLEDARNAIEENYAGEFTSTADFAQDFMEETTEIPEHLRYYIDYERMAQDMEINDILTLETAFDQVHIFWQR